MYQNVDFRYSGVGTCISVRTTVYVKKYSLGAHINSHVKNRKPERIFY